MIRKLNVSRFRSLGKDVKVDLGSLTVLVGANGVGKSNVIDALVFLADCAAHGVQGAVSNRSGIGVVRHVGSEGHPYDVTVGIEGDVDGERATYEITLEGDRSEEYRVKKEHGVLGRHEFTVRGGAWSGPEDLRPHVTPTTLALPAIAGDDRFAPLAKMLRSIAAYSIFPDALRTPTKYDPKRPMDRRGANWVSILKDQPEDTWKPELIAALSKLTGDLSDVKFAHAAGFLVMQFKHDRNAAKRRQWFDAAQESDGTLRVAGILTALLQEPRPALMAIEEPELTVHPGALAILRDYIEAAAHDGQVIVTTHSPDLLGMFAAERIRVVVREGGDTQVHRLAESQREAVTRGLFTIGELMRTEGLDHEREQLALGEGTANGAE